MIGYEPNEKHNANMIWEESIHPDDRERVMKAVEDSIQQKRIFDVSYRGYDRYGKAMWFRSMGKATELTETGQPIRMIGTIQNITQEKSREFELLKSREAAENANTAKSTFLSNMSHELRTPLNAILGFSQIISRSKNLDTDDKEAIQTINRSGEHLLALINDVLDMSKIEAGQITLNEKEFDLHGMTNEVIELCKIRFEKKALFVRFEKNPNVPQYVRGDQTKIRQILMNLLSNSAKFTQEGGVTIRLKCTPNPESDDMVFVRFEVEDTGPGIKPEDIDKIFDPFVQDKTGLESHEGTGLGLPISRRFAQLMKGDLTVESYSGNAGQPSGALFKVDIPLEKQESMNEPPQLPSHSVIGLQLGPSGQVPQYRMLIVDDVESNRQVLKKLLTPLGFDLKEAVNGREAIEIWQQSQEEGSPPHLIWMDIRMPEVDGFEATQEIRRMAVQPDHRPTIIALSASGFDKDVERILAQGCDDFIRKPYKEFEIFDTVKKHLGVHYIYDGSNVVNGLEPLPEQTNLLAGIGDLPLEWQLALKQAIEHVNIDQMTSLVAQIHEHSPSLADEIQKAFAQFEYEKILGFIHKQ